MRRSRQEEAERAAFYEQHMDDPAVWGEPVEAPPVVAPRAGLTATITVRFSADEAEHIRRVAAAHSVSYSQVVRAAVRRYEQPGAQISTTPYAQAIDPVVSGSPFPASCDRSLAAIVVGF